METPLILVANWNDGVSVVRGNEIRKELAGQGVRGLANDGHGGALAIVGGASLAGRSGEGEWSTLAASAADLSCCLAVGPEILVGTDDARVFRLEGETLVQLTGFDQTPGRESWYPGSVVIDGRVVGPPLGVRSMDATSDGGALLVSIHVGGIARSTDGGETWQPTIEVDHDVHEVRAHPTRPDVVIAAAAVGLCVSRDAGMTWTVENAGLHAPYCSAVAFCGDYLFVAASADHFAQDGAVYRRAIDSQATLEPVAAGFPERLDGIADTGCIASKGATLAVVDKGGALWVSLNAGGNWSRQAQGLQGASCVLIC